MHINKTTAVVIAVVLFILASGCATTEAAKLKNNEFQNAIGAVSILAGLGAGAYAGASIAGGNDKSLSYGMAGGLLGAIAAGGVYWIIINLIGEKVDTAAVDAPADDKTLMPEQ